MNEMTMYAIMFCIIINLYLLNRYPKMYEIQILFILLIPMYVSYEWDNLDFGFALICIILPVLTNFFYMRSNYLHKKDLQ